MLNSEIKNSKEILKELIIESAKYKSKAEMILFQEFINHYYAFISYEDLIEKNLLELYQLADKHWKLVQKHKNNDIALII